MPLITPTVGRVVYYNALGGPADVFMNPMSDQPHAAIITHVNSDGTVNLSVFAHDGVQHAREDIPMWDGEGDPPDDGNAFAQWMPFQLGQAKQAARADEKATPIAGG